MTPMQDIEMQGDDVLGMKKSSEEPKGSLDVTSKEVELEQLKSHYQSLWKAYKDIIKNRMELEVRPKSAQGLVQTNAELQVHIANHEPMGQQLNASKGCSQFEWRNVAPLGVRSGHIWKNKRLRLLKHTGFVKHGNKQGDHKSPDGSSGTEGNIVIQQMLVPLMVSLSLLRKFISFSQQNKESVLCLLCNG